MKRRQSTSAIHWALLACALLLTTAPAAAQYVIYPTPQHMQANAGTAVLGDQVSVVVEKGIDQYTKQRLEEVLGAHRIKPVYVKKAPKNAASIQLGIHKSGGAVDKAMAKRGTPRRVFDKAGKFDRHVLDIGQQGIFILGEHTNAVFFALASLEQILEQNGRQVQAALIEDYADQQYRGIVEGYYGYPYSFDSKCELMQFSKRFKLNTYLYGAKSDPYHSGYWRDPYPKTITEQQQANGWQSQDMIRKLSKLSLETKVNFIWAIHPNSGKAVSFHSDAETAAAANDVLAKFDLMHQLGVRQFAIFVDDAGWDLDDVNRYADFLTAVQYALEKKYNKNYTQASDTVKPIHYVPHIYALDFASKKDRDLYFNALRPIPENIVVYTTGKGVWSHPAQRDFLTMQEHMQRRVALWWNYPCNDNKDGRLYTSDMYSNLTEMGLQHPEGDISACLGIVANPMQQGQVSKIGMFGVADYSWNTAAFNPKRNWDAAFAHLVSQPELAQAYHEFAKYVRYEDPASVGEMLDAFKRNPDETNAKRVIVQMTMVAKLCQQMRTAQVGSASDKLLYIEIEPWLEKLQEMAVLACRYVEAKTTTDKQKQWHMILELNTRMNALDTDRKFKVETLEGMGEEPPKQLHTTLPSSRYLLPFLKWMQNEAFRMTSPSAQASVLHDGAAKLQAVSRPGCIYLQSKGAVALGKHSATLSLPYAIQPEALVVGADVLRKAAVSYSADGTKWTKVTKANPSTGKAYIKYVRLQGKGGTITLDESNLAVILPQAAKIKAATLPAGGKAWTDHGAANFADGDLTTFATLDRNQKAGDAYIIELAAEQPVDDVLLSMGITNGDYMQAARIEISADDETWTPLCVSGTEDTQFTMKHKAFTKATDDVMQCAFDGGGQTARYVRLINTKPNTGRWLRLYDIEVNKSVAESRKQPLAEDNSQIPAPELYDGNPYTGKTFSDGLLIFHINQATPAKKVTVYTNPTQQVKVPVRVSADGDKWTAKGTVGPGVTEIDLSDMPGAKHVVLEFGSANMTIHEITVE